MSTNTLTNLFDRLHAHTSQTAREQERIRGLIQAELNTKFDDWSALQKAIIDSDSATEYTWNEYGEISTWFRFSKLSDVLDVEREYLETYLTDHFIRVDWDNDCLVRDQGSCIIVNEGYREHSVYDMDAGKVVIDGDEYIINGEVNEVLRNELIETYMERTGYFPTVLRADGHGNLFLLNTQSTK
jgi:hypothetical protein